MKNKKFILIILAVFSMFTYFGEPLSTNILAQENEQTRGLKPIEYAQYLPKKYANKRPKKKKITPKQVKLPVYKYKVDNNQELTVFEGTEIGVTIWRLREVTTAEKVNSKVVENTRILKRVKGQSSEVVTRVIPERISSNTELIDGDIIRLAIEVPTEGYVYIISQELYINGKYSDPYLVFPSRRDLGKTDRISSGKLLFLPSDEDHFEISSLKETSTKIVEEVFTIVVSQEPLRELLPLESDEPRKLSLGDFEQWKKMWGGEVFKFEQETTAKLAITQVEKASSSSGSLSLSDTDLLPQTIYHVANGKEKALLFTTGIKIKR
ncbi:MAG: hypothetical protein HY819_07795 [Acidobacteria bacterium]|nr:hypothetical protein [Acidobacteriota bacterium]